MHAVINYKPAALCLDRGNEKGESIEKRMVSTLASTGKAVSVVTAVAYHLQSELFPGKQGEVFMADQCRSKND